MFDIAEIDRWYEVGKEMGNLMQFALLDRRALLPFGVLADAVKGETGEVVSEEVLRQKAAAGWFPLLPLEGPSAGILGAPMYAPSRIGMLLKLEREGFRPEELRLIAEKEEWAIDNLYTTEELVYLDDDLETVLEFQKARLEAFQHAGGTWNGTEVVPAVKSPEEEAVIAKLVKEVAYLQGLQGKVLTETQQEWIAKVAFRARAMNDCVRVQLLMADRAQVQAGYSPFVLCQKSSWGPEEPFTGEGILWDSTVRAALAYAPEGETPVIRVPGVLLRGDLVTPTKTLRPVDYDALWKRLDLDSYLKVWAEINGERCCLNCFDPLPAGGSERRHYCSERCRNASKQRRFRERNPMAGIKAQQRYWNSLNPPEGQ